MRLRRRRPPPRPPKTADRTPREGDGAQGAQPGEQATRPQRRPEAGGRIEGRQIELVPGERVVQAWRFGAAHPDAWEPGVYSIVRFTLTAEGERTRLVIDHDAIPAPWRDHIASGYPVFYEQPMNGHFAQRGGA